MFHFAFSSFESYRNKERADTRTRTGDLRITNALLYQLSYFGNIYFLNAGANIICLFDI